MITLLKADERHHDRLRNHETWHTFYPFTRSDELSAGFGSLEALDEDRLPPGAGLERRPSRDADILTYVREGSLSHEDSMGRSCVMYASAFQCVTARSGVRHGETNASRKDWAHVFQLWLRPSRGATEPHQEQKRFVAAQRRGLLCLVASPDGRDGSLSIRQDALMYSSLLDVGHHLAHELTGTRRAWLHVVSGEGTLNDLVLRSGDGAGLTGERVVSFTATAPTEILLLDLGTSKAGLRDEEALS